MLYVRTFGEEDCIKYLVAKSARLAQYPQFGPRIMESAGQNVESVNALRRDGVTLCPGLLPKTDVVNLAIQAAKGQLGRIRDHRREKDENRAIGDYLYLEQSDRPFDEDTIRHNASNVYIDSPLMTLKSITTLVFSRPLIDIVTAYFECTPMITFVKVYEILANDIVPVDTQLFHVDAGSFRTLKAVVYLNDVDIDGGPIVYVRSSHLKRFDGWLEKARYSDEELERIYGKENILAMTAMAGDVVFMEATGFHKGLKPVVCDRNALNVTFSVQPEYGFAYDAVKIGRNEYNGLPDFEKAVADGLVLE